MKEESFKNLIYDYLLDINNLKFQSGHVCFYNHTKQEICCIKSNSKIPKQNLAKTKLVMKQNQACHRVKSSLVFKRSRHAF